MSEIAFIQFLSDFKSFMQEENLLRVLFMRAVISRLLVMDEEQLTQMIQTLSTIEDSKKPSCKDEFNRIMKAGFKK